MRGFNLLIMVIGVAGLSSCGDGGEKISATDNRAVPETGATAQVARLDETQRNGVLEKAIGATGVACQGVTKSERIEVTPGVMGWRAECTNGSAHLIQVLSDGTAKVTSRTH